MDNNNTKTSTAIILANLKAQFQVDLTAYKQAVADYMEVLQNGDNPCESYTSSSVGLSQACYDKIWKAQGCTTQNPQSINSPYPKTLTIDGLVNDSYLWATINDDVHRQGCYGTSTSFTPPTSPTYPNSYPYILIGVGTDGNLWSSRGLGEPWQRVTADDANGSLRSVCTGIDGKTLYCTNSNNQIYYKSSWDYHTWTGLNTGSGLFKGVAACPDGTLLGVGLDNVLYQIRSDGSYTNVKTNPADGESLISVVVAPDGSVFVAGTGTQQVYKKNSYQNLPSQSWQALGSCCISAMTVAPDGTFIGIGMDNSLYTKDSYTDLTTAWKGPYTSSCCVVGVTTISNPNYSATDNSANYASLQGRTWWGTGGAKEGTVNSQEECENMCANAGNCTGATFNPVKRYCWARTGDGIITAGLDSDYALVPKQKAALSIMKKINDKLITINEQITSELKNSSQDVQQQTQQQKLQQQKLSNSYQRLLEQKIEMEKSIQEHNSIEEESENQNLYANQQTVSMRFWTLITCLVLLITITKLFGASNPPLAIMLWLSIIIVLLVLTYSLSSPSGFAMWFIVLVGIILMKSGYLYSP